MLRSYFTTRDRSHNIAPLSLSHLNQLWRHPKESSLLTPKQLRRCAKVNTRTHQCFSEELFGESRSACYSTPSQIRATLTITRPTITQFDPVSSKWTRATV